MPRFHRQDYEFVAADPGHGVACTEDRLESARQRSQDCIARSVAADVVDVLEPVEIDHDKCEGLPGTSRAAESLLDPIVQEHAVGESSQGVAQSLCGRSSELQVEQDSAGGGEERKDDECRDDVIRGLTQNRRKQARDEHERREGQSPRERATQMPP